ncbi:MAG: MFS transporter [Anaerolineales bacterium]|nr:MFS transporter [Anaerolineales bacterium]
MSTRNDKEAVALPGTGFLPSMYFFTFLGLSAVIPYLALYLDSIGFSGSQIGVILSIIPFVSMFSTPFWSGLADASKRHKTVLVVAIVSAIFLYGITPLVSSFNWMVVVFVGLALFTSHLLSLADSATMHMLGEFKERYGAIRFWGTAGWGIGGPLFGWLFNYTGLVWMFWFASAILVLPLLLVRHLQFDVQQQKESFFTDLRGLIGDRRLLLFLFATFLAAAGQTAHGSYLSLLLNQLGQDGATLFGWAIPVASLLGAALLLSMLSEVPIMVYSARLLNHLGTRGLLFISLLLSAGRNLLYAFTDQLWVLLLLQLLHGLTFALLWIAGVHFMARNAPKGLSATAQGLFNAALSGIGYGLGNLVWGIFIDQVGVQNMYAISGSMILAGFGLVALLERRFRIS